MTMTQINRGSPQKNEKHKKNQMGVLGSKDITEKFTRWIQ